MRLIPQSLAGRLAGLLVLTLVLAQAITFALFAGERVSTFRNAYRDDLFARLVSLVDLIEESPPERREQLVRTMSSAIFHLTIDPEPIVAAEASASPQLVAQLASALGKPAGDVRAALLERRDRGERAKGFRGRRGWPSWISLSIRLADNSWLNAAADRPPVPPLGLPFLASFLISAAAVAMVGAFGIRFASAPLGKLAGAADRLGRGEDFEPLPETGPAETRQANIAFNLMRNRLERFIRGRTEMLAAIAHDLRTPITTLRLRAEFIDDAESRAKILETLAEMQVMTEAALAFARGDGDTEPARAVDLTALAESLVEDAAARGSAASFEDSPPVTIRCRPIALKRALGNLIANAAFHGVRARVRIEAGEVETRVVIDDDGPGIPATDLERVFDPFVRLESSRSRETGGAGLGLAIARSIMRSHGGDVRLENREAGGLRAIATLPLGT